MTQTAILGAGVMGETLLSGLVRAGRRVDHLLVGEKRPERARELEERYGVAVVGNVEAAEKADTVAIVVKPQDMGDLLDEIAPSLRAGQLLVSLAAGITTAFIESRVPDGVAVVRVMPNTPALVDEGMAAVSPGSHCDESHLAEAEELMASVGRVLRIPERQQDAVTAISGSGPAYIFFVVESMIEAGVHLGLPRATATDLVIQTLVGSAKMLRETGTHPTVLREQVTSPGGTTASALRELEVHKVRAAFLAAMEAARARSRQLAGGDGRFAATPAGLGRDRRRGRAALSLGRAAPGRAGADPCDRRGRSCAPHLALALPDGRRAVLVRLDRQPGSPKSSDTDSGRGPARARPADGRRLRARLVRRPAPVDRAHHRARPADVRAGGDELRRRTGRRRVPDRGPAGRGHPGAALPCARPRAGLGRPRDDAAPVPQPEVAGRAGRAGTVRARPSADVSCWRATPRPVAARR